MKIRNGFVSNSSSSSFCIAKCYMTQDQITAFKNLGVIRFGEETYISEGKLYFLGTLSNHNTSIWEWLRKNNLDKFAETSN